ncbi:hypothetical protein N7471_003495 [Penicillium samsonianum]|uniref:uncharacterized protein n=1 Tax=Penicillium samsonianum TaxID=1882272 RepID=UPI0025473EB4|nr:uncharacterized protein N7471_003495 [Penicillium samsonianum]KAJ6144042.1 hypothetical protein N7471_003495 [Penicillium samsonianum]
MSEDCLYLNIWAPSVRRGLRKAAVMMFIHGGSYGTGGSSVASYDGTNLVQNHDDLIVVTFNYRLNVFGFPNAPGIDPSKQNLGLLDQVDESYPDNPLVSALGLHSGTAPLLVTAPDHQNWNELSTALGCGVGAQLPTLAGMNECEVTAFVPLSQTSVDETAVYALGQRFYNCPLRESVRIRVSHHVPTWRYLYHGNFTNLSPTPWLGAYHGGETPLAFGNYDISMTIPPSAREVEVSQYIQGAWVAFAKDPRTGLSNYGWPQFSFDEPTMINLALNNTVQAIFTSSSSWDRSCGVPARSEL